MSDKIIWLKLLNLTLSPASVEDLQLCGPSSRTCCDVVDPEAKNVFATKLLFGNNSEGQALNPG